ncbi:MAG: PTS transporter subunit EIIB [Bacilli bacterium]|nr:PTS transporter subunit EIIB [Bacilli bacterium]
MDWTYIIQYVLIAVVLLIISLVIVKLHHKNFNLEINKLVQYLGGKDNILDTEVNMSRFKVTLKDVSIVDKDGIQKLGAKGIVEIDNQLKIIFGPEARALKKYISEIR